MTTLGLDIGGTKLAGGVLTDTGELLDYQTQLVHPSHDPERILAQIQAMLGILLGDGRSEVTAIGVGCAGQIDAKSGTVLYSPNLGWRDVPLAARLAKMSKLPVLVDNDVKLAALGEHQFGAGRGIDDMLCVMIGTGIGGGLVLNGQLYDGAGGFAGEVGHTTVQWDGPVCSCGNRGCLEALAAGPAIERMVTDAIRHGRVSLVSELVGGHLDRVHASVLASAIKGGDVLAREVVGRAGYYLGVAMASWVNLLNPQRIILGGGVVRHLPQLLELALQECRRRSLRAPLANLDVSLAHFGRESGVVGAAWFAHEAVRRKVKAKAA
ncbi:MAG: ROK family protein [Candidatus Sericytochromatia bacterium]|nr:ROK family protein [Candidatus Sericytochromatia bacterium]